MKTDTMAKNLMRRSVVTVRPEIFVRELAQLLDEKGISGAAVVDADGHLVGVASKSDLVRFQRTGEYSPDRHAYFKQSGENWLPKGYHVEIPDRTRVREIMTPAIISANEDTPAVALARMMRRRRIHRVFITRGKKLVGVVTTMDLLRLFENGASKSNRRRKH